MSKKTTEEYQVNKNIDTERPDDNTWNLIVDYARDEINGCLDDLPLKPRPDQILVISNRLKALAESLNKLSIVYQELHKLRQLVSKE